jgi:hypothetical protein
MRLTLSIAIVFFAFALFAQAPIALENPSFEGTPGPGLLPMGWENCGPAEETPPDTHPNDIPPYHFFGVRNRPYDGYAFLGMVARESGTREAISQRLASPFEGGRRYMFSLFMASSDIYRSVSPDNPRMEVNYSKPAILRIWGGSDLCGTEELLAFTVPVSSTEWQEFPFILFPTQNWTHLSFEAYYQDGQPYNGHLLMDYCSDIYPLPAPVSREDLAVLDNAALEALALEKATAYWDLGLVKDFTSRPLIGVCFNSSQFERVIEEKGLRRYVLEADFAEISALIRSLEAIRAGKNLDLLRDATRISLKNRRDVTSEEARLFENADSAYAENERAEPLRERRIEFIGRHRAAVIEELVSF